MNIIDKFIQWLDGKNRVIDALQLLIDECDRHRPLDKNGRHENNHTPTCGCEDG